MTGTSTSWATSPATERSMRSKRSRDTSLELRVRRALHRRGLRYRVDFAPAPGVRTRADIVFTRRRVAVYLDGCFWHGCPVHGTSPTAHADYWLQKLERNRARDEAVTGALEDAGWTVLRFWEDEPLDNVVTHIAEALVDLSGGDDLIP
ncbi:very short patch repair endonuclease [Microbacterium sp. NEAU-LLC]|uniref:Very short patch repair endonuclease n=1 Tax=Microbacterium helvum TaxID=2773713 RepID=A0ABR8NM15_9MICO|nr:very short patch repair endonuclease [Microbacterium helvum]MBD3941204.1 very short patch repair endonuclease [Microbacterium helvum]